MQPLTDRLVTAILADLNLSEVPQGFPERVDGDVFAREYLAYNIVRKLEPYKEKDDVPPQVLRDSLKAFAEAEWNCDVLNRHGSYYSLIDPIEKLCFLEASRLATAYISKALMEVWPRWEAQEYTSGASRNFNRSESLRAMKEGGSVNGKKASITRSARMYRKYRERPLHCKGATDVFDSRFDFVQKTAKAVRFMACEPEESMPLQRDLGNAFRHGLRNVGIVLNDQGINQNLAHHGSVTRTVGTIDLTSASDCVALNHLRYLPRRYQQWCRDLRTAYTTPTGCSRPYGLRKVATMGNGFIFELQSLLYAAWAHGITAVYGGRESDIHVHGDDIIISTECAPQFVRFLEWHGMMVNTTKSYYAAAEPFRESCGKHYLDGRDVTPFYLKEPLGSQPSIFRAYNGLKYWVQRTGIALPSAIALLVDSIPEKDRVIVPPTYSIACGLHFPCRKAIFPNREWRSGYQRIALTQRYLTPVVDDVTEKVCDRYRLDMWLLEPPAELIDRSYFVKPFLCYIGINLLGHRLGGANPRLALAGYPRERQRIVRGSLEETRDWIWVHREVGLGDAP